MVEMESREMSGPATVDLQDFRVAVSQSFVPLRVTTDIPETFRGSIVQRTVNDVSFASVIADRHVVERTDELVRRSPRKFFKISLELEGTSILEQDGRVVELAASDMAVYDTSRPYTLSHPAPFRQMVIQLPHDKLSIPPDQVGRMTAVRLAGSEGLGLVVSPFLATLGLHLEHLEGPAGVRLATNAVDLLNTLFAHELDVARAAADPHWALLQRVRDHIDARLADPDLGPQTIADANFISTRHLHALFQKQGVSVSSYIRSRRLEQCYLSLTDPLQLEAPISAVGVRWGFPDAAHFSRVFKAAYGESPKAVRARALSRGPAGG